MHLAGSVSSLAAMGAAASAGQAKALDEAAAKRLVGDEYDAEMFEKVSGGTGGVRAMTFLVPAKGKAGLDWGMDCCVSRVAPGGIAAKKGIQVGWRVYDVAGRRVNKKSEICDAISAARVSQKHNASKPFKITLLAPAGKPRPAAPDSAPTPAAPPATEPVVAAAAPATEPGADTKAAEPAPGADAAAAKAAPEPGADTAAAEPATEEPGADGPTETEPRAPEVAEPATEPEKTPPVVMSP